MVRSTAWRGFTALTCALVCAVVLVPTSSVSAAAPLEYQETNGGSYSGESCKGSMITRSAVRACLLTDLDLLVDDEDPDGLSAGVHWRLADGSRRGICRNPEGASSPMQLCEYSFRSGKIFEFRVGTCEGDDYSCRQLGHWTWLSGWARVRI